MKRHYEPRPCSECGTVYEPTNIGSLYCCKECAEKARKRRAKLYTRNECARRKVIQAEERALKKPVLKPSTMPDIFEISKKASEMGLSYGEYVALHGD